MNGLKIVDLIGVFGDLSYHMRAERSRRICRRDGLGHGYIAIDDGIRFQCPSNPVAHSVFRDMAFGKRDREELEEFLELSTGCTSMVDVGASGGFFSVLFSASRQSRSTLLSIEPDPGARAVLEDLRARNGRPLVDWTIDSRAVADRVGRMTLVSSGYGAELPGPAAIRNAEINARSNNLAWAEITADCATFGAILQDHALLPDLVKIDIESVEHEMIVSSAEILQRERPRIMLELHVTLLRRRGINPAALLRILDDLGYRRLRNPSRGILVLASEADFSGVVRAGLCC